MSGLPTRNELTDCPAGAINTAIQTALGWMTAVVPVVGGLPARAPNRQQEMAAEELLILFGIEVGNPSHAGHLAVVNNRLIRMQTRLGTLTAGDFRCVTQRYAACGPLFQSEAFVTDHPPVYLCITAFQNADPAMKAFIIVHEVAHLCGAMHQPERYSPGCSPYALQMPISQAIEHAEHYACLVKKVCHGVRTVTSGEEAQRIMEQLSRP